MENLEAKLIDSHSLNKEEKEVETDEGLSIPGPFV